MAAGDVILFDQALVDFLEKVHDLENDEIKLGLTTGVTTPSATTADPRWGAGGTTDFSAEEVTPGGNYAAGGAVLANPTVTLTGGAAVFDADDPAIWAANGSNPNNARWGILYNNTATGKNALAAVDLGAVVDMTAEELDVNLGANIFSIDQA